MLSRAVNLHSVIKKRLESLGFEDVTVTNKDNDALYNIIRTTKPRILLIDCSFYHISTPFMVAILHKHFPKQYIAIISVEDFPVSRAMYFLINGAKAYVNLWEGVEQFYSGLNEVRQRHEFISTEVKEQLNKIGYYPETKNKLTDRQVEILRLSANGYTGAEIAEELHISEATVNNSKSDIYKALVVRNEVEAVRVALYLHIIEQDELHFYGRNYSLRKGYGSKNNGRKIRKTDNQEKNIFWEAM